MFSFFFWVDQEVLNTRMLLKFIQVNTQMKVFYWSVQLEFIRSLTIDINLLLESHRLAQDLLHFKNNTERFLRRVSSFLFALQTKVEHETYPGWMKFALNWKNFSLTNVQKGREAVENVALVLNTFYGISMRISKTVFNIATYAWWLSEKFTTKSQDCSIKLSRIRVLLFLPAIFYVFKVEEMLLPQWHGAWESSTRHECTLIA